MTTQDIQKLIELAKKATPGEWKSSLPVRADSSFDCAISVDNQIFAECFGQSAPNVFHPYAENAAYVSTCSPDKILSLCNSWMEMKVELEEKEGIISAMLCEATDGKWSKLADKESMLGVIREEIENQIQDYSEELKLQLAEALEVIKFYSDRNNFQLIFEDENSSRAEVYEQYQKHKIGDYSLMAQSYLAKHSKGGAEGK